MIYGYARCSTNETKQDISRQVRELIAMGVERKNIFLEYVSGTKASRLELNRLLSLVQPGDTIIATEVSRITRSTRQLCDIIEQAKQLHLRLIFGSFVVDCTQELDAMTEGMLKMWGVFAEIERNLISQRVKSGLMNARSRGKRIGRPRLTKDDIPQKVIKMLPLYKEGQLTKTDFARVVNVSRPTLDKYLSILEG